LRSDIIHIGHRVRPSHGAFVGHKVV